MAVSQTFKNAVAVKDFLEIRMLMCDELTLDPTGQDFKDMEEEVRGLSGLYVPFNGGFLDKNEEHWDIHYLASQQTALISNFCQERIDHVHAISCKLHAAKAKSATSDNANGAQQRERKTSSRSPFQSAGVSDYERQKQVGMATGHVVKTVGGGVGGAIVGAIVAGSIAEGSCIAGILVGAAIGALGGYMLGQEKR